MYCIRRAFLRLTKSCLKFYLRFLPLAALYEYKSYNYRRDRSKAHGYSDAVEAEIKHAHKQISERDSYNYQLKTALSRAIFVYPAPIARPFMQNTGVTII